MLLPYNSKSYQILEDKSNSGQVRPWQDKKCKSILTAQSFQRLGMDEVAANVFSCGTVLAFKVLDDESLRLHSANFCKVRLCPLCAWRRSLKVFGQVSQIMDEATKDKEYKFLFLTLTIRNVSGSELSNSIDQVLKGYRTLFDKKVVKQNIVGAFRALEITHNTNKHSRNYDTYHPHLHCILMVHKSYFHKNYITQSQWVELWKKSVGVEYQPIVHIEKITGTEENLKKAVAETAKYTVKDSDYLNSDTQLQDRAILNLYKSMSGRRLISFRGEFLKIQKRLKLDDCIDGDLVHVSGEDPELRDDVKIVVYKWYRGLFNYFLVDRNNEFVDQNLENVGVNEAGNM